MKKHIEPPFPYPNDALLTGPKLPYRVSHPNMARPESHSGGSGVLQDVDWFFLRASPKMVCLGN
jgi:hypothetical protein